MADRSFKVYIGEDLSPVIDLTDRIDWPNVEATMAAEAGEVGVGSVPVRDEAGSLSLPVKNRAEWVQGSNTLWRGRVQAVDYSRQIQVADRARHQSVTVDDYNIDLQGIPVDAFVRGPEADVARVQSLVATYLSGNPRATTNLNGSNYVSSSNTVTLASRTYSNTEPLDVLREIALETDKEFFVDVDGNLHYDGHDSLAFVCPYYITDRPEEHDADPLHALTLIPNMGPVTSLEGQELSSHVRVYYNSEQYREAGNATVETNHAYWTDTFHIEGISASQAQAIANTLSARRAFPGRSYAMTVGNANGGPLTDAQIGSIKAGMMIRLKARVTPDAPDAFLWRRIRELTWSTPAPGQHYAHLRLDKRLLTSPTSRGGSNLPTPGTPASTPTVVDTGSYTSNTSIADASLTVISGLSSSALYAAMHVYGTVSTIDIDNMSVVWCPNYVNAGSPGAGQQTLTRIAVIEDQAGVPGVHHAILVYRLLSPTPSGTGTSSVRYNVETGESHIGGYWLLSGVNQTTPETDTSTNSGLSGSSSTVTVTKGSGDLVLDTTGWLQGNATITAPVVSAGQTEDWSLTIDNTTGIGDISGGGAHGTNATPTWDYANTYGWWVAAAVSVAPASLGSVNDGNPDTVGTEGEPARSDHRHVVFRETAPTANDDFATAGYRTGTIWVQVDDLDNPTELLAAWVLEDEAEGLWLEWSGGGTDLSGINFLVGTASGDLSNEIVVGTSPGGELGGTWASPTVDAVHSGSAHLALGTTAGTAAVGDHTHAATIPTGYYRPMMDGLGNVVTDSGTGAAIMAYAED